MCTCTAKIAETREMSFCTTLYLVQGVLVPKNTGIHENDHKRVEKVYFWAIFEAEGTPWAF